MKGREYIGQASTGRRGSPETARLIAELFIETEKGNLGLIKRYWVWILVILAAIAGIAAFRLNQEPEEEYFTAKGGEGRHPAGDRCHRDDQSGYLRSSRFASFGNDLEAVR